jgi:hypothetical protein
VCQRGHRLEETWSPEARAAALAARERRAGSFKVGDHVVHDAGDNTGKVVAKDKSAVHIAPDDPASVDWDAIEHGQHAGQRTLAYAHDAPMSSAPGAFTAYLHKSAGYGEKPMQYSEFKVRPPQELAQRGR